MQTFQIVTLILSTVFGGTGIVAFYRVRKTSQVGMSGVEVQDKAATTADWDALSKYWKGEMDTVRSEMTTLKTEMAQLREQRRKDAEERAAERRQWAAERDHLIEEINVRDRWIWEGKPPPPPERKHFDIPHP